MDIKRNFKTIESIKCIECGEVHLRESRTYITVYGNMCIGENGGLLGNGCWDVHGVPVSVMCASCFIDFIRREGTSL